MKTTAKTAATPNVMGWNLVREGSHFWLVNGSSRQRVTNARVEEIVARLNVMVRDAKHWKEQGE